MISGSLLIYFHAGRKKTTRTVTRKIHGRVGKDFSFPSEGSLGIVRSHSRLQPLLTLPIIHIIVSLQHKSAEAVAYGSFGSKGEPSRLFIKLSTQALFVSPMPLGDISISFSVSH